MFNTIMIIAFFLGFIITSFLGFITLTHMKNEKREYFVMFLFCSAICFIGIIMELSASTVDGGLFGVQISYLGSALSAPMFLLFVQKYCERALPKWLNFITVASAIFIIALVFTSKYHTLFYTSMEYDAISPAHSLLVERGILYPLGKIHPIICMVLIVFVLAQSYRCFGSEKKKRLGILLYCALAPAISQLLTFFDVNIYGYGDFSLLFIISAILTIYFGLAKYDLLENEGVLHIKKAFLRDMSHEMNAPLTVIATGIDFADRQLQRENGSLCEATEALDTVREEIQRLGRMVNGMVDLVAMNNTGANRECVDFAALLKNNAEAFRPVLEKENNRLRVEITSDLPDVFVEKDSLVQVITNLFTNAAYHTKSGVVTLVANTDGGYIIVQIIDTGEGIRRDIMPRIFGRGVSGRGGTGLGLPICKTIVEAHGGTITIDSEPEKGTIATFTVPVYGGQKAGHMV